MWQYTKLVLWSIFWLILWPLSCISKQHNRDNCLTWALRQQQTQGGYLVVRWCRTSKFDWFRWPHFLWLPEQDHSNLQHYVPLSDQSQLKTVPHVWFEGYVKTGDADEDLVEN